jgi:hypothetical protein
MKIKKKKTLTHGRYTGNKQYKCVGLDLSDVSFSVAQLNYTNDLAKVPRGIKLPNVGSLRLRRSRNSITIYFCLAFAEFQSKFVL